MPRVRGRRSLSRRRHGEPERHRLGHGAETRIEGRDGSAHVDRGREDARVGHLQASRTITRAGPRGARRATLGVDPREPLDHRIHGAPTGACALRLLIADRLAAPHDEVHEQSARRLVRPARARDLEGVFDLARVRHLRARSGRRHPPSGPPRNAVYHHCRVRPRRCSRAPPAPRGPTRRSAPHPRSPRRGRPQRDGRARRSPGARWSTAGGTPRHPRCRRSRRRRRLQAPADPRRRGRAGRRAPSGRSPRRSRGRRRDH